MRRWSVWWSLGVGLLLVVAVVIPGVVQGPWGAVSIEGPSALRLEGKNLVIVDQGGSRRITVAPDGTYLEVRRGQFEVDPEGPPSALGRQLAWQQGLEGAEFTLQAVDASQEAWADPWRSVVLWNVGRLLVLETLEPNGPLALALVLWPVGAGLLALWGLGALVRAVARWLIGPEPGLRVGLVSLGMVGLVGTLVWWSHQQGAFETESQLRRTEMTFLAQLAARADSTALAVPAPRNYAWKVYRFEADGITPRPGLGHVRSYLAAVRSGTVQSFSTPGRGLVVLVPIVPDSGVGVLVEVRWEPTLDAPSGAWWWSLGVGWATLALAVMFLGRLVSRPRPRNVVVREPDGVPRRWIEAWGPDLLAPALGRLPLVRRVVVVSWPAGASDDWITRLAAVGVVEVEAQGGVRRGISPQGVVPLAQAWDQGGPEWLRVEVVRATLGLVDTGDRLVPLVTLPETKTPESGLSLDSRARRRWPTRLGN